MKIQGDWMSFLTNSLFVSVVGSVLSALIVATASKFLLRRQKRREFSEKVAAANREVIFAMRSDLSEGHLAEKNIVLALIASTARKYGLRTRDMYSTIEVAEELVKEIMDTAFLSAARKSELCEELLPLRTPAPPTNLQVVQGDNEIELEAGSLLGLISITLGVIAGLGTLFSGLKSSPRGFNMNSTYDRFFIGILISVGVPLTIIVLMGLYRIWRRQKSLSSFSDLDRIWENWAHKKTLTKEKKEKTDK